MIDEKMNIIMKKTESRKGIKIITPIGVYLTDIDSIKRLLDDDVNAVKFNLQVFRDRD